MIARFTGLVDEATKSIEEQINANVLSKQRVFEIGLKRLENQMASVEELRRKVEKNYQEGQVTF
jgi:hypothetical protein